MSSLGDLPELIGFFSYSREDDHDLQGGLSTLRNRIQGELRGQLGRTAQTFRLWQDKEAIPSGSLWETEIKNAVGQAVFFIPIITPTVVASPYCRFELEAFLTREAELGRNDLVFPILYIDVPALENPSLRQKDEILSLIAKRQYVDWRQLRHQDARTGEAGMAIERFCRHIRDALQKPWTSPQERKEQQEVEGRRRQEDNRRKEIAEAELRAKEAEARQRAEAVAQSKREAETARVAATAKRGEAFSQSSDNQSSKPSGWNEFASPELRPSNKKKKLMALAAGVTAALVLLVSVGIWLTRNEGAVVSPPPIATAPSPQAPACASGDSICKFCVGHNTDNDRDNNTCIYKPVCEAMLNAAGQRGVAARRYLTRQDQHVSFSGGHVTDCSVEIWGPDAPPMGVGDDTCAGDCLKIDFIWSGNVGDPVVSITNVNVLTPLSPTQEQELKPKDTFQECTKCPVVMVVPAGNFTMGSPASELGRSKDEGQQHKVTIAKQFGIGQYELTFDQWDSCVEDGGCHGYAPSDAGWGRGLHPVINVSRDEASGYVAWLAKNSASHTGCSLNPNTNMPHALAPPRPIRGVTPLARITLIAAIVAASGAVNKRRRSAPSLLTASGFTT